eukprot:12430620-Karenia_brevis.AAC.1
MKRPVLLSPPLHLMGEHETVRVEARLANSCTTVAWKTNFTSSRLTIVMTICFTQNMLTG